MLKIFFPYGYTKSVFSIDYEKLFFKGFRGLIFDIDNTLVHHGDDSTPDVDMLFRYIHQIGFKTLILSNNNQERIERFLKNIDTQYICDAQKPNPRNYFKAVKLLGIQKSEAIFIGDQLFTDILGANRSGIASILVQYIKEENETKIGIRRNLEKIILKFYSWSHKNQNRLGDIYIEEVNLNNGKQ